METGKTFGTGLLGSKEDFKSYRKLQQSGVINMLDVTNGTELTGLSQEIYVDIIKNYARYKDVYKI